VALTIIVLSAGLASLAWQLVLVAIGAMMGRGLSRRAQRVVNAIGSLVVIAIGVTVITLALTTR
jgi:putative Mn2+ efflux pump MntP